jgi:hypothetical protein
MSKPAGTQSYISPTLEELCKLYQPHERIDVRRVSFEKKILEQAMTNFSSSIISVPKPESAEVDITVTDFNEEDDEELNK